MIIKVMHNDGGFAMYGEVDLISVHPCGQDRNIIFSSDVIDHRGEQRYSSPEPTERETFTIKFMNKNQTAGTVIAVHSPVYIMNDHGKTVQTI
jgi:hypothetical protein